MSTTPWSKDSLWRRSSRWRRFRSPTRAYWRSTACRLIFDAGEVHALVGENGAGKSTLIRILSGEYRPDSGRIFARGRDVSFEFARRCAADGIVTIFQELMIVPDMTVAENIVLGRRAGRRPVAATLFPATGGARPPKFFRSLDQGSAINAAPDCLDLVHRTEADRRNRARPHSTRAGDHSGRTHGGPVGQRGPRSSSHPAPNARRRRGNFIRFSPT